jgi:THO complex subunit 4
VEILVSAANAPLPAPKASIAERVSLVISIAPPFRNISLQSFSQPKKDKPKPATAPKAATAAGTRGRGRGRGEATARGRGGARGGRDARGKKKTVEELDAEMEDYFPNAEGGNDATATTGAVVATGDTAMDDEML